MHSLVNLLVEHSFTIILIIVLIFLFAFFAASETALLSINRHQMLKISRTGGFSARLITDLLKSPSEMLISILIGNLTVEVFYFCFFTVLLFRLELNDINKALVGIMSVAIIIMFGEIFPKSLAIKFPVSIAFISAFPVSLLYKITKPIRCFVKIMEHRFFVKSKGSQESGINSDELKMLLDISKDSGEISEHASDIIESIITLSTLRVKNIMIPRTEVAICSKNSTVSEVIDLSIKTRCFNISIFDDVEDNPIGYVNVKDIYFCESPGQTAYDYLAPTRFIPETKLAGELLSEMIADKLKLVHIVDEYGGFTGIVTVHNILRSLIGSYYYNIDTSSHHSIEQLSPGKFRIQGGMPIHAWQNYFENLTDFKVPFNAATIGGLLTCCLGRLPREKDIIRIQNLTFTVETMNRRKTGTIIVSIN